MVSSHPPRIALAGFGVGGRAVASMVADNASIEIVGVTDVPAPIRL